MLCKTCNGQTKNNRTYYCGDVCREIGQYSNTLCTRCSSDFRYRKSKERFYGKPPEYCSKLCALLSRDEAIIDIKRKKTCYEKYGVDHPLKIQEYKNKQVLTNIRKYGSDNPAKSAVIKDKISSARKTNDYSRLLRLWNGKIYPEFTLDEFKCGNVSTMYNFRCIECSALFQSKVHDGIFPRCTTCFPISEYSSFGQMELGKYITELVGDVEINSRTYISPKELDIVVPGYNFAAEYNGIYWHSEGAGKSRSYHIHKTKECHVKGIRLIHVFESEWCTNSHIVKSIIQQILKPDLNRRIYARNTTLYVVPADEAREFLTRTHLQGFAASKHHLGLKDDSGRLVSILSVGRSRYDKKFEYEIIRYAVENNTNIIGGLSKLFTHFVRSYTPNTVLTYIDRRYFLGDGFEKIGFNYIGTTPPKYFYFKRGSQELLSREKFQKHKLKSVLAQFDAELSEWENMQLNGYNRIWDCGNFKMAWNIK